MKKKKSLINAGIFLTFGNYLIKGLAFLTIPIFSRLLSTSDYGLYNSFIAYESLLTCFVGVSIQTSYKNAKLKYKDNYKNYVSNSIIFIIILSIIVGIVFNALYKPICNVLGIQRNIMNMLIIYSFSMALLMCYNEEMAIEYKYANYIIIAIINAVLNLGLSLILIRFVYPEQRYLGRIIGTCIPVFLVAIYIIKIHIQNFDKSFFKTSIGWGCKYSIPLIPHTISIILLSQFDRIMILNMVGEQQAGIYSFAYNIDTIINVTVQSMVTVWSPWFYTKMSEKNYQVIKIRTKQLIYIVSVFVSLLILIVPEIIFILGGVKYKDSIYSVLPIMIGSFFAFLYNIPGSVEYYLAKTKAIAVGTTLAAFINILLNWIFINKYGYMAAAYTTMFTYFLYFLFHFFIAKKFLKKTLFNIGMFIPCICMILITTFVSYILIRQVYVRIIIFVIIFIFNILYEEIKLGIIRKRLYNKNVI